MKTEERDKSLLEIVEQATLFQKSNRALYADVIIGGQRDTLPPNSEDFKFWLNARANERPSSLKAVLAYCAGKAERTAKRPDSVPAAAKESSNG